MYATRRRFGSSRTCMTLLAFVLGVSGCDSRVPVDPNPVQNPPAPPPTTFVLQGTVRGEEGINLAGAKVRLIDARAVSREVTTDANGAFFFTDVAGAVRLIVSHPDYFETFENVLVQGNRSVFIVMVNRVSAADQIVVGQVLQAAISTQDAPCDPVGWDARAPCKRLRFLSPRTGDLILEVRWVGTTDVDFTIMTTDGDYLAVSSSGVGLVTSKFRVIQGVQYEVWVHSYYGDATIEVRASIFP